MSNRAKEIAAIMATYEEGQVWQFSGTGDYWSPIDGEPCWDWARFTYRRKPENTMKHPTKSNSIDIVKLMGLLGKIDGGYHYSGACSTQICFPLKSGGELRFSCSDFTEGEDEAGPDSVLTDCGLFGIDKYGGEIPPGVSGPAYPTGNTTE